jgi:tRNA (guanine26-N2/guanine27-N2)-dimethyltransferase
LLIVFLSNMEKVVVEHSSKILAELPKGDVNSRMETFYNPVMVSNRNISVLLLNAISNKNMKLSLPLAGSGIRALRFLQELKKGKFKLLAINDKKENFEQTFTRNIELNNISQTIRNKLTLHNKDATKFLLDEDGFDYIDLDPFGSPNPFLAATIARISRNGILAITATDTAALTGTYGKVTQRKYWAKSIKNYMMHETGLRILIRKVQLQGIQFDKALTPILAYHKDHYFRIYFRIEKGKQKCDKIVKNFNYFLYCHKCLNFTFSKRNAGQCECSGNFDYAGPLWTGELIEEKLISKMVKENKSSKGFLEEQKFLEQLLIDAKNNHFGFYDLHIICKKYKIDVPKLEPLLKKLKATRTHFSPTSFRYEKKIKDILNHK